MATLRGDTIIDPWCRRRRAVHVAAGGIAILTILAFLTATVTTELAGSREAVVLVKTSIPWGLLILVPALAATGGSGLALARRGRPAPLKARRMRLIAANGVLVLIPAALFLAMKAGAGELDLAFYAVQIAELAAGSINLALLVQNARDGLRLSGRIRRT
jgi:hypothetical protein